MRVADYIIQRLHRAGVRQIFLVTGRGALFLTDAVAKHKEQVEAVCLHHEQSAAFATVAHAQVTGGLGVCMVSTGCASTNAMTGVLSAWQDGVPCIFISGQNILRETTRHTGIPLRTFGQQEADIVALVAPITKYAIMLTRAEDVVAELEKAITLATTGRKGPVWLDIPLDLQSAMVPDELVSTPAPVPPAPRAVAEDEVAALATALAQAQRPVVLLGSGVKSAGAEAEFTQFVEGWQLPVTYTPSAADTYGSARSLSIGSVGAMGCSRAGNFAVQNADLVVVLGSRLNSLTTGPDFSKFARAAQVFVVDLDPVEHSKPSIKIDRLIQADVKSLLRALNTHPTGAKRDAWVSKCLHWKSLFARPEASFVRSDRVDLYVLADALSSVLPVQCTVVTDSGLIEVILPSNLRFGPGMSCIHPASQGAMGFALPASIGAYYGRRQPTVAVIGDGSIMMNLQEMETIRHRKLPIKVLVVNNGVYSIIRRRQRDLFRQRTIGTDPSNGVSCPDFKDVARCFGFGYQRIDSPDALVSQLEAALAHGGPLLCEIMGNPDQDYIELGQARSDVDRHLVRRPLEDQTPFLERALFLSEMLVEPIDQ